MELFVLDEDLCLGESGLRGLQELVVEINIRLSKYSGNVFATKLLLNPSKGWSFFLFVACLVILRFLGRVIGRLLGLGSCHSSLTSSVGSIEIPGLQNLVVFYYI
jgi:hypothetical protein